MGNINAVTAFLAGLVGFFDPCTLPLLPAYLSVLGTRANGQKSRATLLWHGLAFVVGLSMVHVIMGATATALGQLLHQHQDILRQVAAVLVFILGLSQTGLIHLPFMSHGKSFEVKGEPGLLTSFLLGVAFAFGGLPCHSALLGSILLMASISARLWRGIWLLCCFSLGMAIPFLLMAGFAQALSGKLRKLSRYTPAIQVGTGFFMMAMAVLMFFDVIEHILA